jgi:endoglycosylceramidase
VFDAMLSAFTARVMGAIRSVDPSTLVWYEPHVLYNNGSDTTLADFGDSNAGMSWHDYCITANEGGGGYTPDCNAADSLVFANAEKRSAATGDALLLSEFGATDDPAALQGVLSLADKNMMSWQEWHYCGCDDPTTTGSGDTQAIVLDPAKPPSGSNLKTVTLDAITRPYPQAVAGTPESWSFDPSSRKFSLEYTTAQAASPTKSFGPGSETEIAVPARQYPKGYSADVRGGAIRSAPGAAVLRVVACTATDRMAVTVVPGGAGSQSSCEKPTTASPRLRLTLRPRTARRGRTVTVLARVRAGGAPVRGAVVRIGRRRAVTGRRGRATLRVRFTMAGRRKAVARARGYRRGRATILVARR